MANEILDAVLWKRLDLPGHDACVLRKSHAGYELTGTALFAHSKGPCCLRYAVHCDHAWRTTKATIDGTIARRHVHLDIARSPRHWAINGEAHAGLADCHDIDLSFTPATNILPIRRLGLGVGASAVVAAAWLRFPSMTLRRLEQTYKALGGGTYAYSTFGGTFNKRLSFRPSGLVGAYPAFWKTEHAG